MAKIRVWKITITLTKPYTQLKRVYGPYTYENCTLAQAKQACTRDHLTTIVSQRRNSGWILGKMKGSALTGAELENYMAMSGQRSMFGLFDQVNDGDDKESDMYMEDV